MLDWLDEPTVAALIGMGSGAVLGAAARLGRFCTLGAIEDALYGGSLGRLRMWGIAIGVAVIAALACAPRRAEPVSSRTDSGSQPADRCATAVSTSRRLLPVPAPPSTRMVPRISGRPSASGVSSVCGADMLA